MQQIKQLPEDFVVKEISKIGFGNKGNYLYFLLKKKNWNTLVAVGEIGRRLGIKLKEIGFAGNKDRRAVTEQLISIKNTRKEKIEKLNLKDIKLTFLGYGETPVCLGDLAGNYFEIVIRNLDDFNFKTPEKIVNYFDGQRFGGNNVEIGRNLIKKNFEKAVKLVNLNESNDYLAKKKNDFIGALKLIPARLLKMYVHACQSFIWNETVKEVIKKGIEAEKLPLVGFGTGLDNYNQEIKKIINKILEKEKIALKDFIIKQIPELSLEGGERMVFVKIKDFKILEKREDELNKGKKKVKVSFVLPKGSYGTLVVKEMFG